MAVSASINADQLAPAHGDVLTVTYTVTGNDPVAPHVARLEGRAVVGGVPFDVATTVTLPGTPAAPVTFETPVLENLVFAATADPAVFTVVIP